MPIKKRASNCLRGVLNLANYFTLGADPQHTALPVNGLPDVPFGIYFEAVWLTRGSQLPESARIGNGTVRGRVVVGNDALLSSVLEVKRFLIKRPANPIGDCQGGSNGMTGKIGVETEESSYKVLEKLT